MRSIYFLAIFGVERIPMGILMLINHNDSSNAYTFNLYPFSIYSHLLQEESMNIDNSTENAIRNDRADFFSHGFKSYCL